MALGSDQYSGNGQREIEKEPCKTWSLSNGKEWAEGLCSSEQKDKCNLGQGLGKKQRTHEKKWKKSLPELQTKTGYIYLCIWFISIQS
jgi:hypothetical protein